jgi:hypothetical protein
MGSAKQDQPTKAGHEVVCLGLVVEIIGAKCRQHPAMAKPKRLVNGVIEIMAVLVGAMHSEAWIGQSGTPQATVNANSHSGVVWPPM